MNRRLFLLSTSAMAVTTALGLALPEVAAAEPSGSIKQGYLALSDILNGDVMVEDVAELHLARHEYRNTCTAVKLNHALRERLPANDPTRRMAEQQMAVMAYLHDQGTLVVDGRTLIAPDWRT